MENEEKEVGAVATTEETGADKATETKRSFDELLQDKEYALKIFGIERGNPTRQPCC